MKIRLSRLNLYHCMIAFLAVISTITIIRNSLYLYIPQILLALVSAVIFDAVLTYIKSRRLEFPTTAIISGFFIGMLLTLQPFYVPIVASLIAILSKHFININNRHLFNPASFGLLFSTLMFNSSLGWLGSDQVLLVMLFGLFIIYRIKRFSLVAGYFITYHALLLGYALLNNAPLSRYFLSINFFFMLFMLTEPKTTPLLKRGLISFGILTGILSAIFFVLVLHFDPFILALLIADLSVPFFNKRAK